MEETYRFDIIEPKWQKYWDDHKLFRAEVQKDKPKYYILEMFPYPSGNLHMGHVFVYSIGDVVAHVKRLQGFNVLYPMGWDAFGMPAENAAKEKDVHPADWTYKNIDHMRSQFRQLGFSFDWNREVTTCREDYYKWEQYLFLKFWEKGWVYKQSAPVNWSESQQTVLANEQVVDGKDWRTGEEVVQKLLDQYYFKITNYAGELLDHLDRLDQWPDKVKNEQRNWIGRSTGLLANFKLDNMDFPIFTTRPDTIYGVTFMCIAPEHPLVKQWMKTESNGKEIQTFVDQVCRESTRLRTAENTEKKGFFTGKYVENPFNHDKIPLYIANFVLYEYGTGALMAVPAHDQRDFEFAKAYNIPIKVVIQNKTGDLDPNTMTEAYADDGITVNSGPFSSMSNRQAMEAIGHYAEENNIGKQTINYRIRDWLISRQRYWGCPIPIVYDEHGTPHQERDEHLPVQLPMDVDFRAKGNPLASSESFSHSNTKMRRETDTMDTFVCSSWYEFRFCSPHYTQGPFDPEEAAYWMPVDQYIGGIEHARGHLIYARYFAKALRDLGLTHIDEPFTRLLTQGMVVNKSYFSPNRKVFLWEHELGDDKTIDPVTGEKLIIKTEKMSKSKNNGVDPQVMLEKYGADALRLFCLFSSPPEKDVEWGEDKVDGVLRFLRRIYRLMHTHLDPLLAADHTRVDAISTTDPQLALRKKTHWAIKKVHEDFSNRMHFNTGIAALMELYNEMSSFVPACDEDFIVLKDAFIALLRLLFPVCPHFCEELHEQIGFPPSILQYGWLTYKEELLTEDTLEMVFQVNGKVRAKEDLPISLTEDQLKSVALNNAKIKVYTEGKEILKTIIIPGKLVNIVVKN